ncbi:NAD-dependent malic enzyme [Calditerrivibrio nitroreducens]|uniref:Malic protein domain protein n=1 Tax=Calditerrivibrio nitroreducens (strain DSM 19672 / NBRC 101217 / Yu37-1) TaxID=768670 RepID=E4TGG2_CALNY|nr:malic enzyme-like NAD(P)-binding protein [Calditerrivibrio nitroreducens]ADR18643.1 malic protein domain protein [Calditerrivibrio nitroreducens DSM 19672]
MRIEYGSKIIKTLRVKILDKPGYLGRLALTVGELGGMFGEIKTVHIGKDYKVRDLDVYFSTKEDVDRICEAISSLDGIELVEIRDIVQEVHQNGKIEVVPRVQIDSVDDLRLVYTPGVASICKLIQESPELARKYTTIPNNVAIVTNGTAILGLGDIGPVAGMPVMEGKALLFKMLSGINGYPILIDSKDPKVIIDTVKAIAPTFGAIKLEDIKAPECFEIEEILDNELDIPVTHDDQHGTAVVVLAALLNIAKYTFINLRDSTVGIIGLGAAGSGIQKLLTAYGIKKIYGTDLNPQMKELFAARGGIPTDLKGIMDNAKIVIATTGCPKLITPDMVKKGQIILALSNPDPEIDPEDAIKAGALYAADGKAINNALAFPGLFKGALMANAKTINSRMKIAAAQAIANHTIHGDLVPNILNIKVHEEVAKAVEEEAYKSGVAKV